MLDLKKTTYEIIVILKDGTQLDITDAVTNLTWAEMDGEIASKADFTVGQALVEKEIGKPKKYISALLELCTVVIIKADGKECFRGIITTWGYESSTTQEVNITAYDKAYYLLKSQNNNFFKEGFSTEYCIMNICQMQMTDGISKTRHKFVDYKITYLKDVKQSKHVFKSETLADQLKTVMDKAMELSGSLVPYVMRMEQDTLVIKSFGANTDIYEFTNDTNTLSTEHTLTLDGLVTRALVYGKASDDSKSSVLGEAQGKTEFGILQKVIYEDDTTSADDAVTQAKKIIEENGTPPETYTVKAVDVPFVRKGDLIKVNAGDIANKYFHVKSVTHDAMQRQMTMELRTDRTAKAKTIIYNQEDNSKEDDTSNFIAGNYRINGWLYETPYGSPKIKVNNDIVYAREVFKKDNDTGIVAPIAISAGYQTLYARMKDLTRVEEKSNNYQSRIAETNPNFVPGWVIVNGPIYINTNGTEQYKIQDVKDAKWYAREELRYVQAPIKLSGSDNNSGYQYVYTKKEYIKRAPEERQTSGWAILNGDIYKTERCTVDDVIKNYQNTRVYVLQECGDHNVAIDGKSLPDCEYSIVYARLKRIVYEKG